jgi:hypothetical protein
MAEQDIIAESSFTNEEDLNLHHETVTDNKPIECKDQAIKKHKEQRKTKYQCELCPSTFSTATYLLGHLESLHFNLRRWKCEKCDFSANFKHALKMHVNDIHATGMKNDLTRHGKAVQQSRKQHVKATHKKTKYHKCPHCDHSSGSMQNLNLHVKAVHDKIRDHKCHECNFATAENRDLTRHVKAVHDKIRDHKCPHCDHSYGSMQNLNRHVKAVHDKIKDHKCPHCDHSSGSMQNLNLHVKAIHDKIRDHKCQHCNYAATRKGSLTLHLKAVHDKIRDHK